MSGFVAIIDTSGASVDRGLLETLTHSLQCRGPDGQQVWTEGPIGLGHTLFRTTHQAKYENQPASIDGEVWITGSIRVDGREALVSELGDPLSLQTTPDSELVLHAYRKWGQGCLDHLLGDFAFALWDVRQRRLFCARDRFGMRQLYHARVGDVVVISNSLHCMRQHPGISDELDDQAIADFLLFGDHIWTDKTQTAFRDVKTLAPAHQLNVAGGTTSIKRYWDLPTDTPLLKYSRDEDYLEHFRAVFTQAVADRLPADDLVIAMSGGMDSSSIAATVKAIRLADNKDFGLQAITIVRESPQLSHERYFASLVAEHLDLPIQYLVAEEHPLLATTAHWTRPLEHYRPSLWMEFNRQALHYGRVLLTGAAGDNLLLYSPYLPAPSSANPLRTLGHILQLKALYGRRPCLGTGLKAGVRRVFRRAAEKSPPYPYPSWLHKDLEQSYSLAERWDAEWASGINAPNPHWRHSLLYSSLMSPGWNTDDLEMNGHTTLPEQRDPFLDLRLVEFVLSLPPMPWLYQKHILRQSMRGELPEAVLHRPKQVLVAPATLMNKPGKPSERVLGDVIRHYVDTNAFDQAAAENGEPGTTYVNLRPLILDRWLQKL